MKPAVVTTTLPSTREAPAAAFRHEALLYAGADEFISGTTSFIRQGVAGGEPVLVVVDAPKIRLLREALGADADAVHFADMAVVGANPARIIPAWHEFVDAQQAKSTRFRGIGEPISTARTADELVECQRHEELLNLAFARSGDWWLLCPYDVSALPPDVIDEAHRSHPFVMQGGMHRHSDGYRGLEAIAAPHDAALSPAPDVLLEIPLDLSRLVELRGAVTDAACAAGLEESRIEDLTYAVNEVATNCVAHGGAGVARLWIEPTAVVCEVRDHGHIREPLIGRMRPAIDAQGGRGVWLANQLCDLVQVRSSPAGTVVRLSMALPSGEGR
jgi:anti-sigma regulatory factor (Ser/Thr protein kinase)